MANPTPPRNPTTRRTRAKHQATPAPPVATILRWMDSAACADADPDIFAGATPADVDQAKAICARCPVRAQCRDYALTTAQEWGTWGGLSESDRRELPGQGTGHPGIGGAA